MLLLPVLLPFGQLVGEAVVGRRRESVLEAERVVLKRPDRRRSDVRDVGTAVALCLTG